MRTDLKRLKRDTESGKTQHPIPAAQVSPTRRRNLSILSATATCVAIAVILGWLWKPRHQQDAQAALPVKLIPLTTYPGIEQHPSLSPDGTQVAFSWNGPDQANFDIYVKTTSAKTLGAAPLRLTSDTADDIDPVWSPDGSSIAFLRKINASNKFSVLLIPALGGSERKLTEVSIPEAWWLPTPYLSWTPDSQTLVVSDRPSAEHPTALYLLSIATGEKRQLTFPLTGVVGDSCAAVSPDGKMLSFHRLNAPGTWQGNNYVLALDGVSNPRSEPRPISLQPGPIDANNLSKWQCATWTADSERLLFPYGLGLWALPVSRSGENPLRDKATLAIETGDGISGTTVSRTSARLAYALQIGGGTNIWRLRISGAHEKPQSPTPLIASTKEDFAQQYSPDGSKIAFESSRGGNLEVWVCGIDGQNCAQLTQMGASATGVPAWSPDGKQIAFYSNLGGASQIYVISAEGGAPRRLTSETSGAMAPRWSRNGEWIYFSSKRGGKSQIWKLRSTGGELSQVTHGSGLICSESFDGKWLYFVGENSTTGLWKVSVDGGEEKLVIPAVSGWNFDLVDDGVYFVTQTGKSTAIEFLSFVTGKNEAVASIEGGYYGLSVSPDRKWISYNRGVPMSSQLVLAEGFR